MARERRYRGVAPDSFASVIQRYLLSDKFHKLAKSTQTSYRHLLELADDPDALGAVSVDVIRPALVQAFLDGFADRPAQQKCAQTAIKALERWALVRDFLPRPISLGTEAPGGTGGHEPWPDEMVALAEQHAIPHLARIITLGVNTGQRASDLIKMRWTDIEVYEGRPGVNVTQRKTGLQIWIPLTTALQTAMAGWERRPTYIALKEDGQPFTRPQLSDQWVRHRASNPALAPLRDPPLHLHGLRATAVVRLRRAGATTAQICDMVGMSPQMVTRYSRLSEQKENASAAVHLLDRTTIEQIRRRRDC